MGYEGGIWPALPEAHNFVQLFIARWRTSLHRSSARPPSARLRPHRRPVIPSVVEGPGGAGRRAALPITAAYITFSIVIGKSRTRFPVA